jgi:hypothetical protein
VTVTIDTIAGPDAGRSFTLAGRQLVGRSRQASCRVADPAVEPHHVLLDVDATGQLTMIQLAGRLPIRFDGAVLELGDSLLEITDGGPATGDSTELAPGSVPVSVDVSDAELAAALAAASAQRRRRHLQAWRAGAVSLGVGAVRLALDLVDGSGGGVEPAALPVHVLRLVDAAERHDRMPILLDGERPPVIAVVDCEPGSGRGESVARRLTSAGHSAVRLLTAGEATPAECTAMLEVGARWRGRWTPDLASPEVSLRLHVAGRSVAHNDGRALVVEVTRSVAAVGGDVVGVPQAAGRQ